MTPLLKAVEQLGLDADVALSGQWVKLQGRKSVVHVVEVGWGIFYNTWCEDPEESMVRVYCDPVEAIEAGLRRAGGPQGLGSQNAGSEAVFALPRTESYRSAH